jgi:hypothetical protein
MKAVFFFSDESCDAWTAKISGKRQVARAEMVRCPPFSPAQTRRFKDFSSPGGGQCVRGSR